MKFNRERQKTVDQWGDVSIGLGERKNVHLEVSASYSGHPVQIPVHVRRGPKAGPVLFISAAVHGDEINGTGAIRQILLDPYLQLISGSLILVPVVNVLGFERHSRYLPDRRDLNRSFPGSAKGSLASRMARLILDEIIERADYGIDLHTAAVRRTNFPNVRADLDIPNVRRLTEAFGCEVTVNEKGPAGCLRRAACEAGCPTFILEAGEVWKVESLVIEYALRGIKNVLMRLGMIAGQPQEPAYRTAIRETAWIRADSAGFLHFHVAPGDIVNKGTPIATIDSLVGSEGEVIFSTENGIVLGMTTLPVTAPGEPVCHIGLVPRGRNQIAEVIRSLPKNSLHQRIRDDLATSIMVVDPHRK
ncbi:succinylglutamate desuccinylase/aspartoacylase family protein [Planctomicrobium piriforme]|nr:succinylglutamate desuccinylase/aspartoacylase family protein [Planctomicrobium piriforme]